jgi:mutator protein MutT
LKQKLVSIVIPFRFNENNFEVWMQKRISDDELNGMLEFPGGKQEKNESSVAAAVREFYEEVGVKYEENDLKLYTIFTNKLESKTISLSIFFVSESKSEKLDSGGWHKLQELSDLAKIEDLIPPANRTFLKEFITACNFSHLQDN